MNLDQRAEPAHCLVFETQVSRKSVAPVGLNLKHTATSSRGFFANASFMAVGEKVFAEVHCQSGWATHRFV